MHAGAERQGDRGEVGNVRPQPVHDQGDEPVRRYGQDGRQGFRKRPRQHARRGGRNNARGGAPAALIYPVIASVAKQSSARDLISAPLRPSQRPPKPAGRTTIPISSPATDRKRVDEAAKE